MSTREEMEREVAVCRSLFEKKTRDYGTSWRILRLPSLTDQIFIKANRIRSIQESGENRVGDGVRGEFVAMVNYAVMALIQGTLLSQAQALDSSPNLVEQREIPLELSLEVAMKLYDEHITRILDLMMDKNHDYGEAWRQMRISSMVDLILMKLLRIKQIEDNEGRTLVSEGVEGGYMDIVNYSLFCLVRMTEVEGEKGSESE
ncbi:MAG: DUF1599 domain-containing protein [Bacteroidales bacterium]|nr:DUF1599 domain-containing protein [Bacteroidales bacterium]